MNNIHQQVKNITQRTVNKIVASRFGGASSIGQESVKSDVKTGELMPAQSTKEKK